MADNFFVDNYESPEDEQRVLPSGFADLLTDSCLVPAVCAYLRNDSGGLSDSKAGLYEFLPTELNCCSFGHVSPHSSLLRPVGTPSSTVCSHFARAPAPTIGR